MQFSTRRLVAASVLFLLGGCATPSAPPGADPAPVARLSGTQAPAHSTQPLSTSAVTPQTGWLGQSDGLKADPNVRHTQLPNGMGLILMRNTTPAGEASLSLRIDAGSLHEQEEQRGLAHFLEHMVLNGTRNIPEGELIRRLERAGLQFGPDTNASTDPKQTIYKLDLPETDAETIGTALTVLREVAGEATLETSAIDSERGIILSEERTRNSPDYRAQIQRLDFLFKGQRFPRRLPIGEAEVIRSAPRERLASFYDAYYRPERATLVAVGDFDHETMEREVRKRFDDWRGRGAAGPDPDLGRVADRETEALVVVEPGTQETVTIAWMSPPDLRTDTAALRRTDTLKALALSILNIRLERLANGAAPPFTVALGELSTPYDSASLAEMTAIPQPGRWREALAAIEQEQRRLVQHGVSQAELARAVADRRGSLTTEAAGAGTRLSQALTAGLVEAVNDRHVFTSPADDLALFEEVARTATPETVSAAARAVFQGEGPLLTMVTRTQVETGEQALLNAFDRSRQLAVAPPGAAAAKAWAYTDFGTPGRVAERRELPALGATLVRFENGVRLTVRPSQLLKDQILVNVRVGDGRLDIPKTRPSPEYGMLAFPLGGLGQLTTEEVQEVLAGRVAGVEAGVDDDAFTLGGGTRPSDFGVQMQLLAAFLTDPAYRPQAWDRVRTLVGTLHDQIESTPDGVFLRDAEALLRSGDRRWAFPSRQEISGSRIDELKGVLQPSLASEPIEVVITGDITVNEAVRQTAATFGALPARRPGTAPAEARRIAFPNGTAAPVRRTHKGRFDQGLAYIAWPTTDFYADVKQTRALNLLGDILQLRLTDEIREKQGTTYSPGAEHAPSEVFPGYGHLSAQIEAPPDKLEAFLSDAAGIARELRERPVTPDELERARRPRLEQIQRAQAGNEWWLSNLEKVHTDPRVAQALATLDKDYRSITPIDLQRVAREFLRDDRAFRMVVAPEAKPAATAAGGSGGP